ncbi:UNVERIFIED_CONTAM: Gamma-tubulin complex component 5 [Sesamum calycinum]|uniref:Gamma-tubulin complex component n=1 Tax=Sesamum calycinum TaxID=2727403 RepID=A0AAW2PA87_9LAMI
MEVAVKQILIIKCHSDPSPRIPGLLFKRRVKVNSSNGSTTPSILGLSSSLSRLCSGAEYLFQIVHGAIPQLYFELESYFPAADIAVHILNHLYVKLNEVCLVQGGEEDAYRMLLYILVGSLLPYIESLDCWLFQGTLDDPFDEESIRNSADNVLLSTPDSLVVSVAKNLGFNEDEQYSPSISVSTPRKGRGQSSGMDVLDSLTFTYKVSWPLELIANLEAMKKYNQVMSFLLKVKRAKFVLDKARRWMWKGRGTVTTKQKRHWLLEQKLLHFVDAFHQYVMDRVYHNAWRELCEGVAAAGTLDEAIEVHEAYLLSIQRQCFVVPDKLWGLIASRINNILGLALDFYSIQQTLSNGGAISAVKARCGKEVERIEKQFDDCMAFLLRILSVKLNVGQFPHLAALVTRINYNCFYMSDGGVLATAPGRGALRPA